MAARQDGLEAASPRWNSIFESRHVRPAPGPDNRRRALILLFHFNGSRPLHLARHIALQSMWRMKQAYRERGVEPSPERADRRDGESRRRES